MEHYVYRLECQSGRFYIGSRTAKGQPSDDKYTGSGVWPTQCKRDSIPLSKVVLACFETRREACEAERIAIMENIHNPLCMNLVTSCSVPAPANNTREPIQSPLRHLIMSELWGASIKARLIYIRLLALPQSTGISIKVLAQFERVSMEDCWVAIKELANTPAPGMPAVTIDGNNIKLN